MKTSPHFCAKHSISATTQLCAALTLSLLSTLHPQISSVQAQGAGGFVLSSTPGVGTTPNSVTAADINGDSKSDLISANYNVNTLSVLTNNGSGGFVLSSSPSVGSGPSSVTAADVNGDGKVDLITANYIDSTLSVLTNNGSGGFVLAVSPAVGTGPESVVAADVNGDGRVDLICANYTSKTLSVLTNNGSGGFVLASSPAVGMGPFSVTAADVNGDGRMDLISANFNGNSLSVLTNNGSGGFVLASSPSVGFQNGPYQVVAADVNGDGRVDLISANYSSSSVTVLTNNGRSGFVISSSPAVGLNPFSVAAADINGDGRVDLISGNYNANTLSVLTNNGSGGFALASTPVTGTHPYSVTVADVNGDGWLDLISANYGDGTLSVLLNVVPSPTVAALPASGVTTASATLNGVANPQGTATITWFQWGPTPALANTTSAQALGNGVSNTNFSQAIAGLTAGTSYFFRAVASNSVGVVFSTNQTFTTTNPPAVSTLPATAVTAASATLNGLANPHGTSTSGWFEWGTTTNYGNLTTVQALGSNALDTGVSFSQLLPSLSGGITYHFRAVASNGIAFVSGTDQGFTTGTGGFALSSSPGGGNVPYSVAAADVNGDGKVDLVSANPTANTLTVLTNNGSGGYVLSSSPTVGLYPVFVLAADINGDGRVDLVSVNFKGNTLTILTNNGSGGFVLAASPSVGASPDSVVAANLNGDGRIDLACANYSANTLSVLTNNGSGGFVLAASPLVGSFPESLVAADVNGDGRVDLIGANSGANTLSVLTNNGSGGFVLASSPAVGSVPESLVAADVNGDGRVDLISGNSSGNTLSVLTNNGSGGFVLSSSPLVGSHPLGLAAADVNGDGRVDLICGNYLGNTLSVLTNNGSGGFALASSPDVGINPLSVAAADLNGDGRMDLISANSGDNTLSVLLNAAPPTVATLPGTAGGANAAMLNGVANPNAASTTVWFELGTTTNYGTTTAAQSVGNGTSNTNFNQSTAGLPGWNGGMTIQFRAVASNSFGIVVGINQSYTIPTPPTIGTLPPSGIGPSSTALNGVANPQGATTTVWFQWASGGSPFTTNTAPQNIGNGNSDTNFSQLLGLVSGTSYYYFAVASNNAGVVFGTNQNFTAPVAPSVSTLAATAVTATSATLNGNAMPNGTSTSGWFEWGATTNYGNVTSPQALGNGTSANFSQLLTGFSVGVTYHFRAVASNTVAVVAGTNQTFMTPSVTTLPASAIGALAATLNGAANPAGAGAIQGYFEWGTTTNYSGVTASQALGNGASNTNFNQALSGLSSGTTYNFRAVTIRTADSVIIAGTNQSFTTLVLPSVTTLSPSAVGLSAATLNGTANPQGAATTVWFEWGTKPNQLTNSTSPQAAGNGAGNTNFSVVIVGLSAGSLYYFRAAASNSVGTARGSALSFSTPTPSSVATLPASAVGSPNATLNGTANPQGVNTSAWFEWGTTTNYGNVTALQTIGSGGSDTNFSQILGGLFGGITYNFRAITSNSLGQVYGANQSFTTPVFALAFTNLPGTSQGSVAWGDYDNDGRLDILLTGTNVAQLWRNTGNGFSNINADFSVIGEQFTSVAWGDYDNDGRLDFLFAGADFTGPTTTLWQNTGSGFVVGAGAVSHVGYSSVAWGDYDNDGRPDILLAGTVPFSLTSEVWRNTGNGFSNINVGLPGFRDGSVVWGDFDNDGRLDIFLSGDGDANGNGVLAGFFGGQIWRNTGNGFSNINANLPQVYRSSVALGDYDNDGRLDILLSGSSGPFGGLPIAQVWRNTANGFSNINVGLPGVSRGCVAWGDYDNDGRLDILLTGTTNGFASGAISQIWRNTGNGFSNINANLPGVAYSSAAWGDYDNDGRLDILLTGQTTTTQLISQVWRNNTPLTNTPPTAPTGLTATILSNGISFNWTAASDAQTPASGLTYNLRVGSTPGGSDLLAPMASASGLRRLPQLGPKQGLTALLNYTLGTPYYWSVQAIDSSFAGSPFAAEGSFKILQAPPVFVPPTATNIVAGDANGDGVVSQSELAAVLANLNGNGIVNQSELDLVLSNYYPYSPWLYMTNVAGLGGTNVTFALSNSTAGAFSVEYTTNLVDWFFLGPATPRYLFTDTNAPALPQRYYRLRWP